ncbi:MAG: hypothetical protein R3E48_20630 [Burkholderiaceae bacterium]
MLRQSYARVGKAAEFQSRRYANARQFRRMRREMGQLRTRLGRVIRHMERKAPKRVRRHWGRRLAIAKRLHGRKRDSKNWLYALNAPEVECIA